MNELSDNKAQIMPAANIYETESSVIASFELPGFNKEDISINLTDTHIELKVEKKKESEEKKEGYYKYYSASRSFYKRILLPTNINPDEANATFNNGMLRIEAPKANKRNEGTTPRIK